MLSGEIFDATHLRALIDKFDADPSRVLEKPGLDGVVLIRISLLQQQLKSATHEVSISDYDKLQLSVRAALAQSPTDALMWLSAFWLKRLRGDPAVDDLKLLRMSYRSGPNEGWIAIRRSPLSLAAFQSLPHDLQQESLQEFVGLVRSGYYADAADILAGPGWPVRDQLLGGLIKLEEATRRGFANTLEAKDVDDVVVPGLEQRRRDGWR
jgi:hypothetical protein